MHLVPRLRYLLLVPALWAIAPLSSQAVLLTINVKTEIVAMNLQGISPLPLAFDALAPDGYGLIDTLVTVTESPTLTSTGTVTAVIDFAPGFTSFTSTLSSSFELFVDVSLSDNDPLNDFAPGLTDPFNIFADPTKPLTAVLEGSSSLADYSDLGILSSSSSTLSHSLEADINGNGDIDGISFSATSINFDINDINFVTDFVVDAAAFANLFLGNDVTLNFQGSVEITSATVTINGDVADAITDPSFSVTVEGNVATATAAPEPGTGVLLSLGLIGALVAKTRSRRV